MKEMDIGAGVAKLLREEETPDAEPPVADRNIPPVVPPASSEVTEVATHAALVEMVLNGSIDYKT